MSVRSIFSWQIFSIFTVTFFISSPERRHIVYCSFFSLIMAVIFESKLLVWFIHSRIVWSCGTITFIFRMLCLQSQHLSAISVTELSVKQGLSAKITVFVKAVSLDCQLL